MTGSFIRELKRRKVFRIAVIYIASAWVLMQVGDVMFAALHLPEWSITMLVAFLILGFPLAVILAWAYDLTPAGIRRTRELEPDALSAGISSSAAAIRDKSIAVLKFDNRSADAENAAFIAAGVHDELLTLLSRLGDLRVISRTSVERLDSTLSIPEIGKLLGVATVLEGQVQRAGDRLRINMQLIDAAKENHLWANTYDRELTAENVFDVQSDIARTVAGALQVRLSASDQALLEVVPTENTEALNKYLLARALGNRSTFESLRQANRYLQEATKLDSNYAQAWAAIASNQSRMLLLGMIDIQEYIAAAEPAITRALELDDRLPPAHAQLASLHWRRGDVDAAEASFRRALELNPRDSTSLDKYAEYLRLNGRPKEAIPILTRASKGDPLSVEILFELGKSEMYVGRPEQTVKHNQRILEIDPASIYGYTGLVQAYMWMGDYASMWPWFVKAIAVDPEDFEWWGHAALHLNTIGAIEWSDRYLDRTLKRWPDSPSTLKCHAQVLAQRGRFDVAVAIARRALEAELDNRWFSNQIFLRLVRDDALRTGKFDDALARYKTRHPELIRAKPKITVDNINAAADLALLMQRAGDLEMADAIIDAGLSWYRKTQAPGVHGYLINIVDVDLLALRAENAAALEALRSAVDGGWNWTWQWYLANENLDSLRNEPEFNAIEADLKTEMAGQLEALRQIPDLGEFDLRSARPG